MTTIQMLILLKQIFRKHLSLLSGHFSFIHSTTLILVKSPQVCVSNKRLFSDFFKLTRSIRQGCPISALLFLLVAEVLAILTINDTNIRGIKIGDIQLKKSLMADGNTFFLADINSLILSIDKFKHFEIYSGLKLVGDIHPDRSTDGQTGPKSLSPTKYLFLVGNS